MSRIEWQGRVVPPYEAEALPLINPRTMELSGNFRPMVLGAEVELWDGSRGRSRATADRITPSRQEALQIAEQWIIAQTDGLLDPAMFAFAESHDSGASS